MDSLEWPVFTAKELEQWWKECSWEAVAKKINTRLAAHRPAPSESPLKHPHPIPSCVYELAGNAWVQACNQPGGHYFEQVVRPIFEAFFEGKKG